jgi:hypothetical protein
LGDAWTFLAGSMGAMDGAGEWDQVIQGGANQLSYLGMGSCQTEAFRTNWAYSFFAGEPHTGTTPAFSSPVDYAVGGGGYAQMASTSGYICGFSYITGSFKGYGSSVEIFPMSVNGTEYWHLYASAGTAARARCYRRVQF